MPEAPPPVFIPEVLEPDEKLPPDLAALRRFATLLDEAVRIPGTRKRIGLDAGLGFIPGVGDFVSALMSAWIIIGAIRHRVPLGKVFRMVVNVIVDLIIGAFPGVGDILDFFFEQNVMNMRLLMQYRDRTRPPRSTASITAAGILVVLVIAGFAFASAAVTIALILWVTSQRLT